MFEIRSSAPKRAGQNLKPIQLLEGGAVMMLNHIGQTNGRKRVQNSS
jgi:isocitrate/isopropylmalate dehydrogenase